MKKLYFLLSIVYCMSSCISCQTNSDKTPVVGSLDSSVVALDTTMQKGIESSYEFHKSLVVNQKLVYDVIGFGGPASNGEYAILRRGADNKADTVQKGIRKGIIAQAFLADSDKNGKPEVYFVIETPADTSSKHLFKYEPK
jgi:hypothetical protein